MVMFFCCLCDCNADMSGLHVRRPRQNMKLEPRRFQMQWRLLDLNGNAETGMLRVRR